MTTQEVLEAIDDGNLTETFSAKLAQIDSEAGQVRFLNKVVSELDSLVTNGTIHPFRKVPGPLLLKFPLWEEIRRR
jgi:hypothetical protein